MPRLVFLACLTLVLLGGAPVSGSSSSSISSNEDLTFTELLPSDSVITLTLQEAVMQALEHNLDIQVSRQSRDVRLTDIIFQQAQFDPTVQLSGRYDRNVSPLNRPIFGFGGATVGSEPDK
ncbi:MAG: TolC family protein, partial [Nitrospirota bacterium]|nr:TolC family protein [Nitrospirota bacterium]